MMKENLEKIVARIAAAAKKSGRDPGEITLLAVSKRKPPARILEAWAAGQRHFGENYLQEAQEKMAAIGEEIQWHFIGHLQSKKVKQVADLFHTVHTVDRLKVATLLEERLATLNKVMDIYIQVNIGREPQKSGVAPEAAAQLLREVLSLPHLRFAGLMAMPPLAEGPERSRPYFREMRQLAEELRRTELPGGRIGLSMGMSGDFEVAIEEGATVVRLGTLLFGEREGGTVIG